MKITLINPNVLVALGHPAVRQIDINANTLAAYNRCEIGWGCRYAPSPDACEFLSRVMQSVYGDNRTGKITFAHIRNFIQ